MRTLEQKIAPLHEKAEGFLMIQDAFYTSINNLSDENLKDKKIQLALFINKSLKTFYKKVQQRGFKRWEMFTILVHLVNNFEDLSELTWGDIKPIRRPRPFSRLTGHEKTGELREYARNFVILQEDFSRLLRNARPSSVEQKEMLAKSINISIASYHRKGNNRNFRDYELAGMIQVLFELFDSNF